MFLFVCPNLLSVLSNFIPGSPFLDYWFYDIVKDEGSKCMNVTEEAVTNDDLRPFDHDSHSNIEHVTALMTGVIMGRFGRYHTHISK